MQFLEWKCEFRLPFHWSLFLRVQWTISSTGSDNGLAPAVVSICLSQWWLIYWHIYASCKFLSLAQVMACWSQTVASGIRLGMHPANERRCYIVTMSVIGWVHYWTDPWACTNEDPIHWYIVHQASTSQRITACYNWGVLCQKQVSNNHIPQFLWDVITCPCPWYLLLAQHFPIPIGETNVDISLVFFKTMQHLNF